MDSVLPPQLEDDYAAAGKNESPPANNLFGTARLPMGSPMIRSDFVTGLRFSACRQRDRSTRSLQWMRRDRSSGGGDPSLLPKVDAHGGSGHRL